LRDVYRIDHHPAAGPGAPVSTRWDPPRPKRRPPYSNQPFVARPKRFRGMTSRDRKGKSSPRFGTRYLTPSSEKASQTPRSGHHQRPRPATDTHSPKHLSSRIYLWPWADSQSNSPTTTLREVAHVVAVWPLGRGGRLGGASWMGHTPADCVVANAIGGRSLGTMTSDPSAGVAV